MNCCRPIVEQACRRQDFASRFDRPDRNAKTRYLPKPVEKTLITGMDLGVEARHHYDCLLAGGLTQGAVDR